MASAEFDEFSTDIHYDKLHELIFIKGSSLRRAGFKTVSIQNIIRFDLPLLNL